jgi:hypothetical protein
MAHPPLRRMRARRAGIAAATALLTLLLTVACGSEGSGGTGGTAAHATPAAGPDPSVSARMVCEDEAEEDITTLIGVAPVRIDTPTWVDHLYSCRYVYANGSFVLSVKELGDEPAAAAYYDGLGASLGHAKDLQGLGQGAFATTNGSVVVRKDTKVLLVDISPLPPELGRPPATPPDAARLVATAILGCWTGA